MKFKMFMKLKEDPNLNFSSLTNLIVIGDSMFEMDAAKKFGKKLEQCYIKTIKLNENPKPR